MRKKAQREPAKAAAALERARELREALFALMTAVISGSPPPKRALALLRAHWVEGIRAHELRVACGRVVAALRTGAADLDLVAAMIAYRVVQHVLPAPVERLRLCPGPDCSWLFLDRSKAGRRRWCDMAVCGNSAKARRFYARTHPRRRPRKIPPADARPGSRVR